MSVDILEWYVSVSRTTLAQPLSVGKTMVELSSLRFLCAFCISLVIFFEVRCSQFLLWLTCLLRLPFQEEAS